MDDITKAEDMEDEEVVFEGSAIYQHLLEVGYTDFEQSAYTPPSGPEHTQDGKSSNTCGRTWWPAGGGPWCLVLPHHLFGWATKLVQTYIYVSVGKTVSSSKLVSEDDWLVLEHFLPEGEKLRTSASTTSTFPWHKIFRYRDVAVIIVCLALLWITTESLLFLSSLLIGALIIYSIYCAYWIQKMTNLKQFILSLKQINHVTSKSVRLLQEMDLISKGFVLAQGHAAPLASLYEEPPQLSCLRDSLLCTLTSVGKLLLSTHSLLEARVPQYPVIRQLFDEPPTLQEDCTPAQRMHHLKSQVTIIKLQTSAVLTELLLWLQRSKEISDYNDIDFIYLLHTKDVFLEKIQTLQKQYEYNKCFWLSEKPSLTPSHQSIEEKKQNVYLAIHSLGLHLQAAVLRVQSLESKFERESDSSRLADPESLEAFPSYEHFKAQMNALRLELESCQGCVEEAEARAERKYGVPGKSSVSQGTLQDSTGEDEHIEVAGTTKPPTVLLYNQQVAPAEDEVFEAYINQEFVDEEKSHLDEELWCADVKKERQMLRHQKEQGKRVLRELQPILTNRRKMWDEREKVALQKHTGKEQNAVQIMENKEQHGQGKEDSISDEDINESVNIEKLDISRLKSASTWSAVPNQSIEEDELDSDEERLRTYRKIRQELDEDEQQRVAKEIKLKATTSQLGETMEPLQSNMCRMKKPTLDEACVCKEENVSALNLSLMTNKHFPDVMQNICENLKDDREERLENSNNKTLNQDPEDKSAGTKVFDFEAFCSGDEGKITNPECDEARTGEEEIFSHNENIKDDESRRIDWTTFTLPTRSTDTLDDRLHLYSGRSCSGFQAEVAAQASAASRNFWLAAKHPEETFGGVGEGEVFGSDSNEEEKSSSSGDEN